MLIKKMMTGGSQMIPVFSFKINMCSYSRLSSIRKMRMNFSISIYITYVAHPESVWLILLLTYLLLFFFLHKDPRLCRRNDKESQGKKKEQLKVLI